MARSRRLLVTLSGLTLSVLMAVETGMTVQAGSNKNYLDSISGGVVAILDSGVNKTIGSVNTTARTLNSAVEETESTRVMANVKDSLNIRRDADTNSEKLGKLYKNCGGTILERKDGWTKLQSGNLIGWAKDEYLFFGEAAEEQANKVGKQVVYMKDAIRVRQAADVNAMIYGVLPKGQMAEVISVEDGWVCIDYEGVEGYVAADYVTFDVLVKFGETTEEIKVREEAEREAKRHVKYASYAADEESKTLLAAIIHCEARGESYEGQVAVGAVVLNRVRSSKFPNTIREVVYSPGQFSPAMAGTLDKVLESGKINDSCFKAAEEALSGVSNVGDMKYFRRNNGREGLVIGNHVFY